MSLNIDYDNLEEVKIELRKYQRKYKNKSIDIKDFYIIAALDGSRERLEYKELIRKVNNA